MTIPQDWLLYNRVGATLANGGRADEALSYYYKALEINPSYIRARWDTVLVQNQEADNTSYALGLIWASPAST